MRSCELIIQRKLVGGCGASEVPSHRQCRQSSSIDRSSPTITSAEAAVGVERQTLTDKPMRAFEARHLQRHEFHGNWNYTVREVQDQADQHTPRPTTRPDSPK